MADKFYATLDADAERISENASISVFNTRAEAEAFLLSTLDEADRHLFKIRDGRFGDCWIKTLSDPTDKEWIFEPFTVDQLSIRRPGQHPGGNFWWIEPLCDVLVTVMD